MQIGTMKSHVFYFEGNSDFEDKKVMLKVSINKISLPTTLLFV